MKSRSLARELALLVLGQIPENQIQKIDSFAIDDYVFSLEFGKQQLHDLSKLDSYPLAIT